MSIPATFTGPQASKRAKEAGWFSRRHQDAAEGLYADRDRRAARDAERVAAIEARAAIRAARSPQQQIAWLDAHGFVAKKERARLAKQIKEAA